jgi:HlyD family secretion protein
MRSGIKRAIWVGGLLALVATGGWWMQRQRHAADDLPKFRTAAIDSGPITQVVLATGALQPVTTVTVGTQVSGTVLERLADFNDHVRKGQVLLRLDPAALQARLRQARAQLAAAGATLALASASLDRNQRLVAQGFISALALDQSQREADAGAANVELARAQVDAAQTDLENSVIRSPIDGVVIRRNTDVGQTVAASFQTPDLYLLARDLREMLIATNVSEADVGLIRDGQKVRFTVDAYPEREFEGVVQQFRLNSASSQGVVTYTIVVAVANPDELLKPGMTAQTKIVVSSKDRVTRLPTAALRFRPDEDQLKEVEKAASAASAATAPAAAASDAAVRADDDGVLSSTRGGAKVYRVYTVGDRQVPRLHEVTIGISNTRYTELASVVSGSLKPGDAVITRKAEVAGNARP